MESWKFECAECGTVGTAVALPSGRVKVTHTHAPRCKVAKMEKGDMCPVCKGTDTDYNESSAVCLNPDCGEQWELGDPGERFYHNLGSI